MIRRQREAEKGSEWSLESIMMVFVFISTTGVCLLVSFLIWNTLFGISTNIYASHRKTMLIDKSTLDSERSQTLRVGTYNIWNMMFHWDVRKLQIVDWIQQLELDVILLQEVRESWNGVSARKMMATSHVYSSDEQRIDQLSELKSLLNVDLDPDVDPLWEGKFLTASEDAGEGQREGIAVLTRWPIVSSHSINFTKVSSPDANTRAALNVLLRHPTVGSDFLVEVYSTHLSYDKTTQCQNTKELIEFVGASTANVFGRKQVFRIIGGDFNAYNDFESPQNMLTEPENMNSHAVCCPGRHIHNFIPFEDVWKLLKQPNENGFSFSNMPWPGLQSRPDRLLIQQASSTCLTPVAIGLFGNGTEYVKNYFWKMILERANESQSGYLLSNASILIMCVWITLFGVAARAIRLPCWFLVPPSFIILFLLYFFMQTKAMDYIGVSHC